MQMTSQMNSIKFLYSISDTFKIEHTFENRVDIKLIINNLTENPMYLREVITSNDLTNPIIYDRSEILIINHLILKEIQNQYDNLGEKDLSQHLKDDYLERIYDGKIIKKYEYQQTTENKKFIQESNIEIKSVLNDILHDKTKSEQIELCKTLKDNLVSSEFLNITAHNISTARQINSDTKQIH